MNQIVWLTHKEDSTLNVFKHSLKSPLLLAKFLDEVPVKEDDKIVLTIDAVRPDPIMVMGMHDIINFHSDMNIHVQLRMSNVWPVLAILAAVPAANRTVSRSTMIMFDELDMTVFGSYRDNKVALEAFEMARENSKAVTEAGLGIELGAINGLIAEKKVAVSTDFAALKLSIME